jgi:hypothetical protein
MRAKKLGEKLLFVAAVDAAEMPPRHDVEPVPALCFASAEPDRWREIAGCDQIAQERQADA